MRKVILFITKLDDIGYSFRFSEYFIARIHRKMSSLFRVKTIINLTMI